MAEERAGTTEGSAGGLHNSETAEQARLRGRGDPDSGGAAGESGEDGAEAQTEADGASADGGEQRVSWLELFSDLLYSTAFSRVAQRLETELSGANFAVSALLFAALWWMWFGNTNFSARYGNASRTYRWGTVAQLFPLGALALAARGDLSDVAPLIALAYAAGRAVLALMYLRHAGGDTLAEDRALALGFGVGALVWAGSAALPPSVQPWAWAAAILLDLGVVVYTERRFQRAQPHREHFPERVGLLMILLLGAAVTEVVTGAGQQPLTWRAQLPGALALASATSLWRLYFDENKELPSLLAARTGQGAPLHAWVAVHLPLLLSLTGLGVGLHYGLGHDLSGGAAATGALSVTTLRARALVGASLTLFLLCLTALRTLAVGVLWSTPVRHREGRPPFLTSPSNVVRLLAAAALLLLIPAALNMLAYLALVAALLVLAALVSWLDPGRRALEEATEEVRQA